jgi:exopolyphosphatase/guanosine-5'-triphosphate,3'-diphosphate pyrophosphatase
MRDAENQAAVMTRIRETLGLSVDLLSGDEEAAWSFAAACAPFDDRTGDCLVVDVGGGSTELIIGPATTPATPSDLLAQTSRTSLNVGCVRLTERCFPRLPPPRSAVSEATNIIDAALRSVPPPADPGTALLGTAGTATALALVHAGPESRLSALPDDALVLSAQAVHDWRRRLLSLSVDDILPLHPTAMPGRADVFPVGVLLLDRIMHRYDLDPLRVSPYELRYGLALRYLAAQTSS